MLLQALHMGQVYPFAHIKGDGVETVMYGENPALHLAKLLINKWKLMPSESLLL